MDNKALPTSSDTNDDVTLVRRDEWEARPSKTINKMETPVSIVFIHHTAGKECSSLDDGMREVRAIQDFHMDDRGWDDIGYNFLLDQAGHVYEGRGWDRVGAHTLRWNDVAVAFSVLGNFTDHVPNDVVITAINKMILCGTELGKLTNDYKVYGHRDVRDTSCPGDELYKLVTTWSHYGPLPPVKPTPTQNLTPTQPE